MPPAADWTGQEALATVMGQVPRILAASVLAFWAGEFANAFVLARMKLLTGGRMLWTRTIGSTAVGQGVDSLIFYPLAFLHVWPTQQVAMVMVTMFLNFAGFYIGVAGWAPFLIVFLLAFGMFFAFRPASNAFVDEQSGDPWRGVE